MFDFIPIIWRNLKNILKYQTFFAILHKKLPEVSVDVEKSPVHSSFSFEEHFERPECNEKSTEMGGITLKEIWLKEDIAMSRTD